MKNPLAAFNNPKSKFHNQPKSKVTRALIRYAVANDHIEGGSIISSRRMKKLRRYAGILAR